MKPEDMMTPTQTQHTPGPWWTNELATVLQGDANDPQVIAITEGDIMCVENPDEALANARLIAAAPELLEALKDMLIWANIGTSFHPQSAALYKQALAAIARAEGRAQ